MENTHLNVQKPNVTRTMSETILYGKVIGFMILERLLNSEGMHTFLIVHSSLIKKHIAGFDQYS